MSDYKITFVDEGNINKWDGPKGTVYYIPVNLEGHEKLVSIGKKSADALKIGDTVSGDIIPTDRLEDKWKAAPFISGETQSGGQAKRTYGAIQADRGDGMRQGMIFNNACNYVGTLTTLSNTPLKPVEWAETVYKYATALYAKGDLKVVPEASKDVPKEEDIEPLELDVK